MRTRRIWLRIQQHRLLFMMMPLAFVATACLEANSIPSCVPNVEQHGRDGAVYFQQSGPGQPIQWGAYAYDSFVNENGYWRLKIYYDGNLVEEKNQDYPPHASVNQSDIVAGRVLEIEGTVSAGAGMNGYSFVGHVSGICRMQ